MRLNNHHASDPRSSFVWRLSLVIPSTHATISSFVRRLEATPLPRHYFFIRPAASPRRHFFICLAGASIAVPQSFQRAGQSHRRATIFSAGRPIPSPRCNHFSGPVNHIAAPQSFQRAGESHCRAAIFSTGRRISLPCRNLFSGLANPIVSGGSRIPSLSRQTSSRPAHHRRACCITAIQSKKPHYH